MEILSASIDALDEHRSEAVLVVGDAGVGKSRLISELRDGSKHQATWLEATCRSITSANPLTPIGDLIRVVALDGQSGLDGRHRDDLLARVAGRIPDVDATSVVGQLLGTPERREPTLDPASFFTQLRLLLTAILAELPKPTVVCLHDIHWADPSTINLLAGAVEAIPPGVLVLLTTRPSVDMSGSGVTTLTLGELNDADVRTLVTSLLAGDPPPELERIVLQRCGGNAFFIQETIAALLDEGALIQEGERWRLRTDPCSRSAPMTVIGVLAARIDRLDPGAREVLLSASVLGVDFAAQSVAPLSDGESDVKSALAELLTAGLLEQNDERGQHWRFRHALVQEVAYQRLTRARREVLHGAAADTLAKDLPADSIARDEVLAYHYSMARRADQAVPHLLEAGKRATDRYALIEADRFYATAYDLLTNADPSPSHDHLLVKVIVDWCQVHYYKGIVGDLRELLDRHREQAQRCGDRRLLGMYLAWSGDPYYWSSDLVRALDFETTALSIANHDALPDVKAYASAIRSWCLLGMARGAEALDEGQQAVRFATAVPDEAPPQFIARSGLGMAANITGHFTISRTQHQSLVQQGQRTGNAREIAAGYAGLAALEGFALNPEAAVEQAASGVAAARDPLYLSITRMWQSIYLMQARRYDEAESLIATAMGPDLAPEVSYLRTPLLAMQAVADRLHGHLQRGLRTFLAQVRYHHDSQSHAMAILLECVLAEVYSRIAAREVRPTLKAVIANPNFVMRHALPAARNGQRLLQHIRSQIATNGCVGFNGLISATAAELAIAQRRWTDARHEYDSAIAFLLARDLEPTPALTSLERRIRRP